MNYLRTIIAVLLAVFLTTSTLFPQEFKPAKPSATDKCPVCGMFVAKYPDFVAQIIFQDDSGVFFDGVKDMMKYYFDLPRYNPAKKVSDIRNILVGDYYTLAPIDGREAFYVIGSNAYGPMGKELIPFKEEAAAKEFLADHKGKAVLTFPQITPEVVKGLD